MRLDHEGAEPARCGKVTKEKDAGIRKNKIRYRKKIAILLHASCTQMFASLLQGHFPSFLFHMKINSAQSLHFFHDANKGLWHSFKYSL